MGRDDAVCLTSRTEVRGIDTRVLQDRLSPPWHLYLMLVQCALLQCSS